MQTMMIHRLRSGRLGCVVALVGLGAFLTGCDPSGTGTAGKGGVETQASRVTARSQWKASGNVVDAAKAIDGSLGTRAVSRQLQEDPQITIDLGLKCLFNMVVIEHGQDEHGYARRVAVSTSRDGKNFTHRHSAPGNRRVTHVAIITPVLARYVRISAVGKGSRPWSLAEIRIQ